jgi:hypothetical protein
MKCLLAQYHGVTDCENCYGRNVCEMPKAVGLKFAFTDPEWKDR